MTFNCDQCDASYTVRSSLSNHKRLKHGHLKTFSCQHCKYETKEKQNFVKHVRSKHDKIKEICIHCEKSFSEKSNLSKHVRKFHPKIVQDQNKNLDKMRLAQKLINGDDEYTMKKLFGEKIHRNIIKHAVHEANIPIRYQESYEIYMKEKKSDDSGINSNQSEMFEDNRELSKIYDLLQRMTNKNV